MSFLDLLRWPGYVVPTVLFPAMFFTLFDLPYARHDAETANHTTLAFIIFAIVGVTLYQFGVGIAQERGRPWERYLRTLPVSAGVRFGARIATAIIFGILTAAVVALVARIFTPIDLSVAQWLRVLVYALAGGVPFVLDRHHDRLLGDRARGRSDRHRMQFASSPTRAVSGCRRRICPASFKKSRRICRRGSSRICCGA